MSLDPDDVPEVVAPDDLSALFLWLGERLDDGDMAQAEELVTNLVNSFGGPDDDDMATYSGLQSSALGIAIIGGPCPRSLQRV